MKGTSLFRLTMIILTVVITACHFLPFLNFYISLKGIFFKVTEMIFNQFFRKSGV